MFPRTEAGFAWSFFLPACFLNDSTVAGQETQRAALLRHNLYPPLQLVYPQSPLQLLTL